MIYIITISQHSITKTFDDISYLVDSVYSHSYPHLSKNRYHVDPNQIIINDNMKSISRVDWIEDLIEDYKIEIRDKKINDILK